MIWTRDQRTNGFGLACREQSWSIAVKVNLGSFPFMLFFTTDKSNASTKEGSVSDRDHYGNEWRLTASGQLEVAAPGAEVVVVWDRPGSLAQSVATDDHGFIWLVAGAKVYFSNPRAIADSETPDASEQRPGSPGTFTAVNPG